VIMQAVSCPAKSAAGLGSEERLDFKLEVSSNSDFPPLLRATDKSIGQPRLFRSARSPLLKPGAFGRE
jgi:hypothetical protein